MLGWQHFLVAGKGNFFLVNNFVMVKRCDGDWRRYESGSLDLYTKFRTRILLFSSVAFKRPTKNKFFGMVLTVGTGT
jgi:hypothetical protein